MKTGHIHAARFWTPRTKAVYLALVMGPGLTTREIIQKTGYCAINSIVSELRENGVQIECKRIDTGIYQYRMCIESVGLEPRLGKSINPIFLKDGKGSDA